jgi:hypothetical protein
MMIGTLGLAFVTDFGSCQIEVSPYFRFGSRSST